MLPGWTAEQLFEPSTEFADESADLPGEVDNVHAVTSEGDRHPAGQEFFAPNTTGQYSDVSAIFANRSEFTSAIPPNALLSDATRIRASGLSLNLICQHYADNRLVQLIRSGMSLQCLFLDPAGDAIKAREREEGWPSGHLSSLTALNISGMQRIRDRLTEDRRDHLQLALYDQTIRFNIILVDDSLCIVQPYLSGARGVDAPTLVIRHQWPSAGLYPTFDQMFRTLWEGARLI